MQINQHKQMGKINISVNNNIKFSKNLNDTKVLNNNVETNNFNQNVTTEELVLEAPNKSNNIDYIKDYFNKKVKINYSNIEDDGFKAQGITEIDGKYYISAYQEENNSRIYIYDKDGNFEGNIILDNKAHVGGISYDKTKGILFVAGGNGTVNAYNTRLLNEAIEEAKKNINDATFTFDLNELKQTGKKGGIKIDNTINDKQQFIMENTYVQKTSTLYYDGSYLYAATFDGVNKGDMLKFEVKYNEQDNKITYNEVDSYKIPKQTQGIAITKYNGKNYLIVSQSIGKHLDSDILLYELGNNGDKEYIGKYKTSINGLEGVTVNEEDGTIVFVSEFHNISKVTTMEKILNRVDKDRDLDEKLNDIKAKFVGIGYNTEKGLKIF